MAEFVGARGAGWAQVATFVITGLLIVVLAIAVRDQLPRKRASGFAVMLFRPARSGEILAAFRVDTAEDALSKRYQDAAAQLGHVSPAVRLAGAYAMADLADDWEECRQQCVDVLCAYVRINDPGSDSGATDESHICNAIMEVLQARLSQSSPPGPTWTDCFFDLAGVTVREFYIDSARLGGGISFEGATIEGEVILEDVSLAEDAVLNLNNCLIEGQVQLHLLRWHGALLLSNATIAKHGKLTAYGNALLAEHIHLFANEIRVDGFASFSLAMSTEAETEAAKGAGDVYIERASIGSSGDFELFLDRASANYFYLTLSDWSIETGATVRLPEKVQSVPDFESTLQSGAAIHFV